MSTLTKVPNYVLNNCGNLESVLLPDSVTAIGDAAFNACRKLTQVNGCEEGKLTLPDTITSIGSYAFADCDSLTEATIPDSVTSLGSYALANNDNLEKAVIGEGVTTLPSALFYNDPKLKSVEFKGPITEIPASAFQNCKALEDFDLWDGLIKIGASAFAGCTSLPEANFPGTLTTIGVNAYDGCTKLTDITFSDQDGDAPLTIGNYAFRNTGISSVTLPERLTSLGTYAFANNANLENVDFGDNTQLTSIPNYAFYYCPKLSEIEIPSTIKSIGGSAFQSDSALRTVIFPADSQLETIGSDAFRDDRALTEIKFPKTLTTISGTAFYYCTGLKSVDFPEDGALTSIGSSAFSNCQSLEQVTLPPSLTTLGGSAFYNCTKLKEADLSQTAVKDIQSGTFQQDTSLTSVKLPPNLETIGNSAFYNCTALPAIDLPETLKSIGSSAFYNNSKLESVKLPDSVTSIGTSCFNSCAALKTADLSDGITTIPNNAFASCTNLEEVDWPAELTTINNQAFYYCSSLKHIDLPDTVKTIGSEAFRGCYAAETITVPRDCTSVAANAFNECKSLENMLWDAKDASIAAFNSGTKFTLTLGKNVDNLSADALKNLVAGGANMLAFEGENYLTLPDTSGSGFPRPLNNLEAGKYFADADGALYKINDDGTATLVYVPDGLTDYTIPAYLPGEDGGEPVPVTRVRDNALTQAQSLVHLTVENPEGFTTLDSYAFAYASNLESVNGETSKALAANLFTGATKGTQLFYGTKLTDANVPLPTEGGLIYNAKEDAEDAAHGWSDSIVVTITESAQSRRQGEEQNEQPTRTKNQPLYQDPETGVYGVYTGESITTSIFISNPDSTAIADGDKIRVYFQLEDGGYINYAPGTYTAVMESIEADANGQKIRENTIFKVVQTAEGAYYLEFDRPKNGYTIGVDIISQYPSPNSGGGDALVWAEYHEREDAIATAGWSSAPDYKYHEMNWTTKRDEFPVTKTVDTASPTVHTEADGVTYITAQNYTIAMSRSGSTLEGIGKDHMESADFVDIFTLPNGMKLNDAIRDDILNDRITYSNVNGQTKSIFAPSFGTSAFMSFYTYSNYQQYLVPRIELVEGRNDQIKLTWTYVNANPNYTTAGQEITTFSNRITVADKVFCLSDEAQPNTTYKIHNEVKATEHFCYSDDVEKNAEVDKQVAVGSGKLEMTKSGQDGYRGEYNPFTITLSNSGVLPLTTDDVARIDDTIDQNGSRMHYITADNIERMLADTYGDALTLTISNGYLYGYGTSALGETQHSVIRTDGSTGWTSQQYTSTDTDYAGMTSTDTNLSTTDAVFTFTKGEGGMINYKLTSTKLGLVVSGSTSDVQALFDTYGYFVTYAATYKTSWNFNKIQDFTIDPGEKVVLNIRSSLKDTFMRINGDTREYDSSAGSRINNYAYAYKNIDDTTSIKYASTNPYYYNDARIDKSYTTLEHHTYKDEYTEFEVPDVLQYTLSAQHYGRAFYDCMPLTDHMMGRQVMMVPVEGNDALASLGLSTYPEDGDDAGTWYLLDKDGTYNNVWTGEAWADHITVVSSSEQREGYTNPYDRYDTYITWYLPSYGGVSGTQYTNMHYRAHPLQNEQVSRMPIIDVANETWLSDHESHRLYDNVTLPGGIYGVFPLVTGYDKKIVDYVGDTAPGYDYCPVIHGKQVVYRLTFANSMKTNFTLTGKDFYDILPGTWADFAWSRDNVKIDYLNFETNDPDDDKWSIVTETSVSKRIKWNWNDDDEDDPTNFSMTCTSPDGIGYIYITVDFPDDLLWDQYVQHYNNQILTNTLYVRDATTGNYGHVDVTHDLYDTPVARLQKGVYATGGKSGTTGYSTDTDIWRESADSRLTYENDDVMKRKVYYYITLHNGGNTNLYLNEVQDVLPKGFTLCQTTNEYRHYDYRTPRIASSGYASVTNAKSYASVYGWIDTTTEMLADGRQLVRMNIKPNQNSSYYSRSYLKNESYFQYNKRLDKYYLKPGQAVVIRLECYTNEYEDTEDISTNIVTMPVYDYFGMGVDIANSTSTAANASTALSKASKNDGSCDIIDTAQAGNLGYDTTDQGITTEWLESEVTLTRGTIYPGINKRVTKAISINSENEEVVTNNPVFANPLDRLIWTVTARNDGGISILDHTLSDKLYYPYYYDGTFTYRQVWNNTGNSTSTYNLFTIDRDTEAVGAGQRALPTMTITNSAGTSYTLTVDGDPVEMEVPNWPTNLLTNVPKPKIRVAITSGEEDGAPYEALSIRFLDDVMCIPDSGYVVLTVPTANLPGYMQNKVFYNTAYVTPMKQTWDGTVNEGNLVDYDTGLGENTMSVRNSDQITTSYGSVTSAIKKIEEKGRTSNAATSIDTINYIVLSSKEKEFTYTLTVKNDAPRSIDTMVLLDNLPELNDHTTFQATDMRNSPFTVQLTSTPNFTLAIWDGSSSTTVPADKYTVEVSPKTLFGDADWVGIATSDWTEWQAGMDPTQYRSIRLIFKDLDADEYTALFKPAAELRLRFDCIIDPEDPNALPGLIAWNGFGYHYTFRGNPTELEAAPRLVGIKIPDYPKVTKALINARGDEYVAEQDETFRFVLYSGTKLSNINDTTTEEQIISRLRSNRRNYVFLNVVVPAGQSISQVEFAFNNVMGQMYTNSTYTESTWTMTHNTTYTIQELPVEENRYIPGTTGGINGGSFSFTYDQYAAARVIPAVNTHNDWSIKLAKTDQFGAFVGGAVFALYTTLDKEKIMAEEQYTRLTPEALTEMMHLNTALKELPEYTIVQEEDGEEVTYTLSGIYETAGYGWFQVDDLEAPAYLYKEVAAPEHYELDSTVNKVNRDETDSRKVVQVTAEDTYLADGEASIQVNKELDGRPLSAEEFEFKIEGFDMASKQPYDPEDVDAPPMPDPTTATNDADGIAAFANIALDQDDIGKTYYYRIKEVIPDESHRLDHVTYDETTWIAKLTVTNAGDGELGTAITYSKLLANGQETAGQETADFVNTFRAQTEISMNVAKQLSNKEWTTGETYQLALTCVDAVNTADGTPAALDNDVATITLGENTTPAVLTKTITQEAIGKTYTYQLTEIPPDEAIGFDAGTGERQTYRGNNLTYAVYKDMSASAKSSYPTLRWILNDVIFDNSIHTVVVTTTYEDGEIKTSYTIDGKASANAETVTFDNAYSPANARAVFGVRKQITGRNVWISRGDIYRFTYEAETEGAPLPDNRTIEIDTFSDNATGVTNARAKSFPAINFTREDLKNADGSYDDERDFIYVIREIADEDNEKAIITYDDGSMTDYNLSHVHYDLTGHKVKVHVEYVDEHTLETSVTYMDGDGEWVEADKPFVNEYREEPTGFDVTLQKMIDEDPANGGEYSFDLFREDGTKVTTLTYTPDGDADGKQVFAIAEELGLQLKLKESANYKYYLIEVVPDEAAGFTEDGERLAHTWGDATTDERTDDSITWSYQDVAYEHLKRIDLNVNVYYNDLLYDRVPTVTYSVNGSPMPNAATFVNSEDERALGEGTIGVRKVIEGRPWFAEEGYTFVLTPEGDAPMRIADASDMDKPNLAYQFAQSMTVSVTNGTARGFETLHFELSDLGEDDSRVFAYRLHENVPNDACVTLTDGSILTYEEATEAQRTSYAGHWEKNGTVYRADTIVYLKVTNAGDGTLTVEGYDPETRQTITSTDSALTVSVNAANDVIRTPIQLNKVDEDGNAMTGAQFTLQLVSDLAGNVPVTETVYTFEAGAYSAELADGHYKLTETRPPVGKAMLSGSVYLVISSTSDAVHVLQTASDYATEAAVENVTIREDSTILIEVKNEPQRVVVDIRGNKRLVNKELEANAFTFQMIQVNEDLEPIEGVEPIIMTNDADGSFGTTFEFTYYDYLRDAVDGVITYRYIVTEQIPEDADQQNIKDQIIYDDRSYLVTIQLSLDDNGVLTTSGPVVEELNDN